MPPLLGKKSFKIFNVFLLRFGAEGIEFAEAGGRMSQSFLGLVVADLFMRWGHKPCVPIPFVLMCYGRQRGCSPVFVAFL